MEFHVALVLIKDLLLSRLQMFAKKGQSASTPLFEIFPKPGSRIHDLGEMNHKAVARLLESSAQFGMSEEGIRLIVQLSLQPYSRVGFPPDGRATSGAAIDSEMDARILELTPDEFVFQTLERNILAFHLDQVFLEDVEPDDGIGAQIPDGVHLAVLHKQIHDRDVVQVDVVGKLIVSIQSARINLGQGLGDLLHRAPIFVREPFVVHPFYLVVVGLEDPGPSRVIGFLGLEMNPDQGHSNEGDIFHKPPM